jgi:Ca-activated chloride channel family protein
MSTPRINPNDPKWTAYVLGELDKADIAAVEHLLEASAEARALVDELRMSATMLEDALDEEPALRLTPAQRATVRAAADTRSSRWFTVLTLPRNWLAASAAAAAIVIAVMLPRSPQIARPGSPDATLTTAPAATAPERRASSENARHSTPATPAVSSGIASPGVASPDIAASAASPVAASSGIASPRKATAENTPSSAARADFGGAQPLVAPSPAAAPPAAPAAARAEAAPVITADASAGPGAGGAARREAPASDRQAVAGGLIGRGAGSEGVAVSPMPASPPPAKTNSFAPVGPAGILSQPTNTELYARVGENGFVRVSQEPLATFSIDVDTASYSNVRRFLTQNQMPPADAVRTEELINYFTYDYPRPSGPHPIGASLAATAAPWNSRNRLVRIGVKAREIDAGRRPSSNLVFLIDVSGSMQTPQKLPLVKSGLKMLVDQLGENDAVSIVVYAGASGLVLPPTRGNQKDVIARALDDLQPGGSTNGAAGIRLAYNQATAGFIRGGTNRVILMTDGDFNVGMTSEGDLTRLIEDRAKSGVFLSVLGFGMGNLKDSTLEKLADTGNGNYAYIDSLSEARKVLVEQMSGTLVTVAKDVKIQVDFNPAKVEAYRLIGYENRALRPEDFNNDLKDAGDMGAGHTVTALFEIVPRGGTVPGPSIDPSVFQPRAPRTQTPPPASSSNDMLVLRVRYKLPDASTSTRMDVPLADRGATFAAADTDFRFAAAVAAFGMILKDSPYRGDATLNWVLDTATASRGQDRGGYRNEFMSLVQKAIALDRRR